MKTRLRTSLLAASLGAALSAHAITLSLDTPNLTVTRPAFNSTTYVFYGTYVTDAGTTISGGNLYPPEDSYGDSLLGVFDSAATNAISFGFTSYTGPLFDVTVDSTSPLATYNLNPSGPGGRAAVRLFDSEGFAGVYYSVKVQAVPEPSALAALGLGGFAVASRPKPLGRVLGVV